MISVYDRTLPAETKMERTQIDANDPLTDYNWIGDGVGAVGRIRKELLGLTKGKWQLAGWCPLTMGGASPTPHTAWVDTARIATHRWEEYWDRCKQTMWPKTF